MNDLTKNQSRLFFLIVLGVLLGIVIGCGGEPEMTCDEVDCGTIPVDSCDGNDVVTSEPTGECTSSGECIYEEVARNSCTGDTPYCVQGACTDDGSENGESPQNQNQSSENQDQSAENQGCSPGDPGCDEAQSDQFLTDFSSGFSEWSHHGDQEWVVEQRSSAQAGDSVLVVDHPADERTAVSWDDRELSGSYEILFRGRTLEPGGELFALGGYDGSPLGSLSSVAAGVQFSSSQQLLLRQYDDGSFDDLETASMSVDDSRWYFVRLHVEDANSSGEHTARIKSWDGSLDDEPEQWQLEAVVDSAVTTGLPGLFVYHEGEYEFDFFSVGINGAEAPAPEVTFEDDSTNDDEQSENDSNGEEESENPLDDPPSEDLVMETGFESDDPSIDEMGDTLSDHPDILTHSSRGVNGGVYEIVDDPTGAANQAWQFLMDDPNDPDNSTARVVSSIHARGFQITEGRSQLDMYIDPDIELLDELGWLQFQEIWIRPNWVGEDHLPSFRISFYLHDTGEDSDERFRFHVRAQEIDPGEDRVDFWEEISSEHVPIGTWFRADTYYKMGGEDEGRIVFSIEEDGESEQLIFDITDYTHHPDEDPHGLYQWHVKKLYTGRTIVEEVRDLGGALQIFWDDWNFFIHN